MVVFPPHPRQSMFIHSFRLCPRNVNSSSLGAMWVVFCCGDTSKGGLLICLAPARRDRHWRSSLTRVITVYWSPPPLPPPTNRSRRRCGSQGGRCFFFAATRAGRTDGNNVEYFQFFSFILLHGGFGATRSSSLLFPPQQIT